MKIHIPNSAFLGNINAFIKGADFSNPDLLFITANKKWISVHPVVLCMVAALGVKARRVSNNPEAVQCERFTATSKHYFERMNLFKMLQLNSEIEITKHEPAGRFIPLTNIRDSNALGDFIANMIPLLHLKSSHVEPIKYLMSELIRNVIEHASALDGAFVAAQYYKKTNTIRIGIVDTGMGIRTSIRHAHKADTDREAIRLALTPGITGTTMHEYGTDYNAGAGLFFSKSIAKVNQDMFVLYTGNTLYKLLREKNKEDIKLYGDPFLDRHTIDDELPDWQGTVIGIDMKLDENIAFTTLLDYIHTEYTNTVRERRKKQFKKAKFV